MNWRNLCLRMFSWMLRLYPSSFRDRYAREMVEIAEAAEPKEWPFIFGDTGITILRSWMVVSTLPREPVGESGYLQLARFPVGPFKLANGFALAAVLVLAASYVSTLTVWNLPSCHVDGSCAAVHK